MKVHEVRYRWETVLDRLEREFLEVAAGWWLLA